MIYLNYVSSNRIFKYFYDDMELYLPSGFTTGIGASGSLDLLTSGYHVRFNRTKRLGYTTGHVTGYDRYLFEHFEHYLLGYVPNLGSGQHFLWPNFYINSNITGYLALQTGNYFYDELQVYNTGDISHLNSGIASGWVKSLTGVFRLQTGNYFYDEMQRYAITSITTLDSGIASGLAIKKDGSVLDSGNFPSGNFP